jgi:hypothetical protein
LEVIGSLVTAVHDEGYGLVDTFVSDTHKVMTCDHVLVATFLGLLELTHILS